ncbi:MAG: nucleotidyltransferase domain-containing protein [Chloroflexaceae bacterium]|nr:nucleotidyltransferase domain-containing protein [Chloroflexaceae bacterium]
MRDEDELGHHTEPPRLDEAGLIAFLATQEDIVAAYLFGSLAEGRATPRSDIDIAVLLGRIPDDELGDLGRRLQLMEAFRRFADREVDVIILNTAPPLLRYQVLRHGRRLFERDRQARVEFEVRTGQEYEDLKPMYDFFNRDLFAKIKEVGLVGRRRADRTSQAAGTVSG